MGFDNECIINIQSLAGEYFCPVCRLLVYPNEALQSQCTHLYCKPCLTYIVSTTRACPYDGYLVTEADSKPLIETNKALAETIGKIAVHCLYHRSGCTWQGPLSECTSHCSGCAFGNSPVVCNRCGIQIVHSQVQEHAQNCPGVQPQAQQAEGAQDAAATGAATGVDQTHTATQAGTTTSQAQTSQTATAPTSGQDPNQQANSNPQAQAVVQPAVPTPEQWYQQQQQQYQQYYQQYPGYDPYQQQYQQYYPYQQQAVPQYQQAHPPHVGQHQPQAYMQPQSQPQPHPQPQVQPQAQAQPQALPQPQSQPQTQPHAQPQLHPHVQAAVAAQHQTQVQVNTQHQLNPTVQPHSQIQLQTLPPPQGHQHPHPQPYSQAQSHPQPHPMQSHPQQHPQMPQYQQPHSQMQNPHQPQHLPLPQPQPQPQPQQVQPQAQVQYHSQPQPQPQPQLQLHPQPNQLPNPNAQPQTQHLSAHSVTGHQSYPQSQPHQQMQLGAPQTHAMQMQQQGGSHPQSQHPVQMHGQFSQQPPQMRPPLSQAPIPNQQQPALLPSPGQVPNIPPAQQQPVHPHAQQPGHPSHQRPVMQPVQQSIPQQYVQPHQPFPGQPLHQQGSFVHQQLPMQSQLRPQGPPHSLPQHSHAYPQPQQNLALSHGIPPHQSKNHAGRPMIPIQGVQSQPYPQSAGGGPVRQLGANQPSVNQSNLLRTNNQVQFSEQQSGATLKPTVSERHVFGKSVSEQEAESSSQKTAKMDANGLDTTSGSRTDAGEIKTPKSENDIKSMDDDPKPLAEVDAKTSLADSSSKEVLESIRILGTEPKDGEPVSKQMVKEEPIEGSPEISNGGKLGAVVSEDQKDVPSVASEQVENSALEDKKIQEAVDASGTVQPSSGADEALQALPTASVPLSDSYGQNVVSKGVIPGSERRMFHPHGTSQAQPPLIQYGPSPLQQRPAAPTMFQAPPPGGLLQQAPGHLPSQYRPQGPVHLPHQGHPLNPPERFQSPVMKQPYGPEIPPGGVPGSFGRGSSHYGHPVAPQGPYNQGHVPPSHTGPPRIPQSEAVGGLPLGVLPPGAFDSHGGMMARGPPHGPDGRMGLQRPTNPMEADMFPRRPDPRLLERGPLGQPSGIHSDMTRMNGAPILDASSSLGLRDGRFKALSDERLNPLPVDPARRISDRGEFEEDLKQFPMPSHLDSEPGSKFGSYLPSSRPLDKGPHGFDMDRPFDKGGPHGLSFDTGRSFPPYHHGGTLHPNDAGERSIGLHEDIVGRSDHARIRPDFYGPGPGYGRRHMDGLARSPVREHPGISSRGLKSLPGVPGGQLGLEDIDGRESRRFGEGSKSFNLPPDPIGNSFHESRFPALHSHLRRGDFEGPGNLRMGEHFRSGDLIGQDILPSHLRRGEHLGPRHLRLGDPVGFGAFPGHSWMGELTGPGRIAPHLSIDESFGGSRPSHPRLGEPGFRSSYSLQGDLESFDNSRRRKAASMGWCRICKVDCETVEGLDLHSQTREHQKIAMDMVRSIKQQNAKKQKLTSSDHSSHEDTSKSRNASFEGRGNKH